MKTPVLNDELRVSMQEIAKKLIQFNGTNMPKVVDLVLFGSTALHAMGIKDNFNDIDVYSSVKLPGTADQESLNQLFSVEQTLIENDLTPYELDVTDCPYLLNISLDKLSFSDIKDQPIAEDYEVDGIKFNFRTFSPLRLFLVKLVASRDKDISDLLTIGAAIPKLIAEEKEISHSKATIEAINSLISETRFLARENQDRYEAVRNLWTNLTGTVYECFDFNSIDNDDKLHIVDMFNEINDEIEGMEFNDHIGEECFPIYEAHSQSYDSSESDPEYHNNDLWDSNYG